MTTPTDTAYLAIIDDLEARAEAAETRVQELLTSVDARNAVINHHLPAMEQRIAALEAAAQAVVDWATVADAIAGYPACRCCGRVIDGWDLHATSDCSVGALAVLLEGTP